MHLEFTNLEVIYLEVFCAIVELLKWVLSRENATDEMIVLLDPGMEVVKKNSFIANGFLRNSV